MIRRLEVHAPMIFRSTLSDPLGLGIRNWIQKYGSVTVTVNGGNGVVGASGRISLTRSRVSVYIGVGWGIGLGASVTGDGRIGNSAGWSGVLSASGSATGVLGPGVRASGSMSQGGPSGGLGVGFGLGIGASVTGGYSFTIWHFADSTDDSAKAPTPRVIAW